MEWKIFFSTFLTIFLAELGDKTQLAVLTITTQTKKPLIIFLAAILALGLSSLIAVVLGNLIGKVIPSLLLKRIAALAFILMGIMIFLGKF
ncbi:MAG: hypothetical protein DRG20_01635 [Deltaproteobacteria bacterium]|nr:MAG: hypothetical protein DRG20_01635 [Deltaproteobacteria bacterium]